MLALLSVAYYTENLLIVRFVVIANCLNYSDYFQALDEVGGSYSHVSTNLLLLYFLNPFAF